MREHELFPIPEETLEILEEETVETPSPQLRSVQGMKSRANYIMRLEAEKRALEAKYKPLIQAMEADIKEVENRIEFQKTCIMQVLIPSESADYTDDDVSLFYKKTEVCEVTDPDALPLEYSEVITKPKTMEIKRVLQAGTSVPGATLVQKFHLQVKSGGTRAQKNASARSNRRLDKILGGEETFSG